jgi:tetratricopeptide (TPR) repeat protein
VETREMQAARFYLRLRQFCNVSFRYLRNQRTLTTKPLKKPWLPLVAFQPFVTVQAFSFGFGKQKEDDKDEKKKMSKDEHIIEEADKLYTDNEIIKLYDYLVQHKDTKNDEILWRLARATCDKGKHAKNTNDKKACFIEAFEYVKQALELNNNNYASHKWYAILLDYTAEYEGTKQRITNAFHVKEHFMKAIELNPKDATSIYSLGYWCFLFADMPWYQRKIASAVFATPPTSTYEEALAYFKKAEETEPSFYSMNLLMLGKTYVRQKNYEMATKYLKRARDFHVRTPDDQQAHKEALELLKSIGVKSEEP